MQININISYKLISTLWVPSFLQGDTIIINGHDQAFSKYTFFFCFFFHNRQFLIRSLHIFAISQGNRKDEVDFLPADKRRWFLQIDSIILGASGQACPNYPK